MWIIIRYGFLGLNQHKFHKINFDNNQPNLNRSTGVIVTSKLAREDYDLILGRPNRTQRRQTLATVS